MVVVAAAAAIAAGVGAGAVCAAVNEAVRQNKARGNELDRRVGMVKRGVRTKIAQHSDACFESPRYAQKSDEFTPMTESKNNPKRVQAEGV